MFKIGIAFFILAIPFILIILGLANVKEKMFTAFLQITCGVAILLVVFWDWVEDWGIAAHISLGEALIVLPMFVFAYIVGDKIPVGTKSGKKSAAYQSPTANHLSIGERRGQEELFDKAVSDWSMGGEMKVARQVMHEDGIDYESCVNCGNMANAMPDEVKATMLVPEIPEKSTGKGINFKYVGAAAMGVVLGAVGLYKFFGKKQ